MGFLGTFRQQDTDVPYTLDLADPTTFAGNATATSADVDWANEEIEVTILVAVASTEPFAVTHTDGTSLVVITPFAGHGAREPVAYRVDLEDESTNRDWFSVEVVLAPDATQIVNPQQSTFRSPVRLFGVGDSVTLPGVGERGYFRQNVTAPMFQDVPQALSVADRTVEVVAAPTAPLPPLTYGNEDHEFPLTIDVSRAEATEARGFFPVIYYLSPSFSVSFTIGNLFRAIVPPARRPRLVAEQVIAVVQGTQYVSADAQRVTLRADSIGVRRFVLSFQDLSKSEAEREVHVHYGYLHVVNYLGRETTATYGTFTERSGIRPPEISGDARRRGSVAADAIPPPELVARGYTNTFPARAGEVPMHFILGELESFRAGVTVNLEDPKQLQQAQAERLTDPLFDWPARILAFKNEIPWPRQKGGEE